MNSVHVHVCNNIHCIFVYTCIYTYKCTHCTLYMYLWYLLVLNDKAEVFSSAGRLEHPHCSLLHLPGVVDVLEARKARKMDVQLDTLAKTPYQILRLHWEWKM